MLMGESLWHRGALALKDGEICQIESCHLKFAREKCQQFFDIIKENA